MAPAGNFQSPNTLVSLFPSVSKVTRGIPKTKLRHFYGVQPLESLLEYLGLAIGYLRAKAAKRKQSWLPKRARSNKTPKEEAIN